MLVYYWKIVCETAPTIKQRWLNVLFLLGRCFVCPPFETAVNAISIFSIM